MSVCVGYALLYYSAQMVRLHSPASTQCMGVAFVQLDCSEQQHKEHALSALCTTAAQSFSDCMYTRWSQVLAMCIWLQLIMSTAAQCLLCHAGIDRWASTLCAWRSLTRSANTRSGMHNHVILLAFPMVPHTWFMLDSRCGLSIALSNDMIV